MPPTVISPGSSQVVDVGTFVTDEDADEVEPDEGDADEEVTADAGVDELLTDWPLAVALIIRAVANASAVSLKALSDRVNFESVFVINITAEGRKVISG
ncbi:hypothetical protein WBG78_07970 [Chryseolinea sp. T2]|uniref:hypothetical protein n=1 Tax=Chryseolinea sp. T2 TaxID=3129255 RepID=UPI003076EFED